MDEKRPLEPLQTQEEFDAWVRDAIVRPLVRIATSDASQADRRRQVEAMIERWDRLPFGRPGHGTA